MINPYGYNCSRCAWWGAEQVNSGTCRFNAPVVMSDRYQTVNWRTVSANDWCSEWVDASQPPPTGATGIKGVTDGSNAAAGYVGEFLSAQRLSTAGILAATGVDTMVASLALTAGDWQVWGSAGFTMTNCTGASLRSWLNAGGATSPPVDQVGGNATDDPANNSPQAITPITPMRVSSATAITVVLGATPTFGGSNPVCNVWGKILARRVR